MPMCVIVTRDVPARVRGFLASCMLEIAPGVYTTPFVSPARAGMDRSRNRVRRTGASFPRTRGDGPGAALAKAAPSASFPRTRGDGPRSVSAGDDGAAFPPHARGWTLIA